MSVERIILDGEAFDAIVLDEDQMEGILADHGSVVWPGYSFFGFKPPISGGEEVRHPDAALISADSTSWWVIEVERHTHDVEGHIRPQLLGLSQGFYGAVAREYMSRVHGLSDAQMERTDWHNPSFLLVIDHVTPPIARAAALASFEVMQCVFFKSRRGVYAIATDGAGPALDQTLPQAGVDLRMEEESGIAILKRIGRSRLPESDGRIKIGGREFRDRRTNAGEAIALPLSPEAFVGLLGESPRYRLTSAGEIIPLQNRESNE